MEEVRNYYIEDAKNQRIIFKGTQEECDEWCKDHAEDFADKILIIRKGMK